jgi:Domain of unknown function (DUF6484)
MREHKMSGRDVIEIEEVKAAEVESNSELSRLLKEGARSKAQHPSRQFGIVIGELIGMTGEGRVPLVLFPGQRGTAAIAAQTVIDLHGPHIGKKVALMFEGGNGGKPIVMGVLRENNEGWPLIAQPGRVEVDADGQRMIVSAKEQVVLKCGKASITLTAAGKVLIRGEYILSQAASVNRVKGGSIQLN